MQWKYLVADTEILMFYSFRWILVFPTPIFLNNGTVAFFNATSFMSSLIQQQSSENKKTFIAFQYHKWCSSIQSTAHKTKIKQDFLEILKTPCCFIKIAALSSMLARRSERRQLQPSLTTLLVTSITILREGYVCNIQ